MTAYNTSYMNLKRDIPAVVGLIVIVLIVIFVRQHEPVPPVGQAGSAQTLIAQAHYACDKGKFIDASFFEGSTTPPVQAGQPPVPNGTADVALDGGAAMTLHQTLSADGARYANDDESFVFWNKGDQALIMRGNSMDMTYTNCMASTTEPAS